MINPHPTGMKTHDPSTQRNRVLENWIIRSYPANTPGVEIFYLSGVVTHESGEEITDFVRLTHTSPIAKCEDGVVTTASGSTYKLGKQRVVALRGNDPIYPISCTDTAPHIPECFWNLWISGDNWLTY